MKQFLKLGLPALMLSTASYAYFPADGWYTGGFLVGSFFPEQSFTLSNAQLSALSLSINQYDLSVLSLNGPFVPIPNGPGSDIKYQFGGGIGWQFGYRWCGFRFEGELLYDYNTFKSINIGGVQFGKEMGTQPLTTTSGTVSSTGNTFIVTNPFSMSGHTQVIAGLFNVIYDFYNHEADDVSWFPYVGLGIGYANIQNEGIINYNSTTGTFLGSNGLYYSQVIQIDNSSSSPLAQGILGVTYQADDYFSIFADYRYVTSRQLKGTDDRISFNSFNIGFNYWMNA
ncbi:P44/Msp2 family outer membrane protein [Legionella jordanis]|uniref:outer membrane protein n=1 Tax=Legionella jordanis TaxID=456 RepID=UPI000F007092|nr:P44/Msp2 family outer membrane protein [Legionella jordanis]RMX19117.1 P44/Msp2 family outer membrane protein [Legionella jordanis]